MKIFKKVSALKAATAQQDGSNAKYLLLLFAIAGIVKIFTNDATDAKIDALVEKVAEALGVLDIFAQTETDYNDLVDRGENI